MKKELNDLLNAQRAYTAGMGSLVIASINSNMVWLIAGIILFIMSFYISREAKNDR